MSDINTLQDLEGKFNNVMMSMINYIAKFHNVLKYTIYIKKIEEFIEEKPDEPISLFLIHIYDNTEYRNNILDGNDDFFNNNLNNIDNKYLRELFEFKKVWKKLDVNERNYIKKSMEVLVKISKEYILKI